MLKNLMYKYTYTYNTAYNMVYNIRPIIMPKLELRDILIKNEKYLKIIGNPSKYYKIERIYLKIIGYPKSAIIYRIYTFISKYLKIFI